jgi:NAD(P)-dependent dehydrogenase (short-subunit alcohol dehydrogenase family)
MSGLTLEDKVAVVTGSGRSLGRAYAAGLAAAGAAVIVNDVDEAAADETVALITEEGGRAVAQVADVADADGAQSLVDRAVTEFGRLDIMVTNAGVLRDRVLWKMSDDDFDLVIRTHLRGTFMCARAAVVRMREQGDGGRLILISSPAGQFGGFGQTNYSAAKGGIVTLAQSWSMELKRDQITANAVLPIAWTPMTQTIPMYKPLIERVNRGEPLPRALRREHGLGMPDECAPLVVFLASDAAAQITGQAIGIGGDRLSIYSHRAESAHAFHDDGWTVQAIAQEWDSHLGEFESHGPAGPPPLDIDELAKS